MIPWMWKSGMTVSERSAAVSCSDVAMFCAERGQVPLAERHDLRPRRRAGRVEHERFVVGVGRAGSAAAAARRRAAASREPTGDDLEVDRQAVTAEPDDRRRPPARRAARPARCRPSRAPRRGGRRGRSGTPPRGTSGSAAPRSRPTWPPAGPAPSPARWAGRWRSGRPARARPHAGARPAGRPPARGRRGRSTSPPTVDQGRTRGLRRQQGGNGVAGHGGHDRVADRSAICRRRIAGPTLGPVRVCIVGAGAIGGLLGDAPGRRRRAGQRPRAGRDARRDPRHGPDRWSSPTAPSSSHPRSTASDDLAALRPAGRRRPVVEGAPDRRGRRSAGRRCTTRARSSSRSRTACPGGSSRSCPGRSRVVDSSRSTRTAPSSATSRPTGSSARIAYPAAEREEPGVIRLVEGDRFPVGELDGSRSERVAALAQTPHRRPASRRGSSPTSGPTSGSRPGATWRSTRSAPSPGRPSPRSASCPATRALAAEMMREAGAVAERARAAPPDLRSSSASRGPRRWARTRRRCCRTSRPADRSRSPR